MNSKVFGKLWWKLPQVGDLCVIEQLGNSKGIGFLPRNSNRPHTLLLNDFAIVLDTANTETGVMVVLTKFGIGNVHDRWLFVVPGSNK